MVRSNKNVIQHLPYKQKCTIARLKFFLKLCSNTFIKNLKCYNNIKLFMTDKFREDVPTV